MLLKDLEVGITNVALDMMAMVVIKRDGEFYEVAVRTRLDKHSFDRTQGEVGEFITKFLEIAEQTSREWKLIPEENLAKPGGKIHQVKIEL